MATKEATTARLTSEQVWKKVAAGSFAVLGYVTPRGEPRASGVVYKTIGRRLYVAVAPDSWKARHIAASGKVSVTVPVRRGGILSLLAPIPPATVSFHGTATVYPAGRCGDPSAPRGAGRTAADGAAGLRVHHRDRPRGSVRDLRDWRLTSEDA